MVPVQYRPHPGPRTLGCRMCGPRAQCQAQGQGAGPGGARREQTELCADRSICSLLSVHSTVNHAISRAVVASTSGRASRESSVECPHVARVENSLCLTVIVYSPVLGYVPFKSAVFVLVTTMAIGVVK